ncbi:D-alanyl-D-alanine carboxypeptidase family protein [Afipia sp. P52-10]|uniref:D-alanyl-D-alanine carboxypeptidase family protein n=1 Tax=Afipia sp. P52-10 TaxID=1429916 RepID=UPI0004BA5D11
MHHLSKAIFSRLPVLVLLASAALLTAARPAQSEAMIVAEADTGKVIYAENATHPWYPASTTKLMTLYVALKAVKERRLTLDKLLTVSPIAAAQAPSKMGFRPGTTVTLENALAMVMVKSANDMAVVVAEGVSGSIEKFADEMNRQAQRLGMTQTSYVNPNGLPAEGQITSARDMAILARAIIRDLPEYEYYTHIPAIKFGRRITRNYNSLIGRYPGADGMKTGFICASGFNLVASATRNGRRLIAVVLGAPSATIRAAKAAQLLERGFGQSGLSWLTPSMGTLASMEPIAAPPPNLRDDMCGPKRKRPGLESDDDNATIAANSGTSDNGDIGFSLFASTSGTGAMKPSDMLALPQTAGEPMIVYTGPKRTGAELIAAVEADEASQTPKGKKGKKSLKLQVTTEAKTDTKLDPKASAKPAALKKQAAKNDPKPNLTIAKPDPAKLAPAKPAAAAAKGGGKPEAKPATAAKNGAKNSVNSVKDSAKAAAAAKPVPSKPKPAAKDASKGN